MEQQIIEDSISANQSTINSDVASPNGSIQSGSNQSSTIGSNLNDNNNYNGSYKSSSKFNSKHSGNSNRNSGNGGYSSSLSSSSSDKTLIEPVSNTNSNEQNSKNGNKKNGKYNNKNKNLNNNGNGSSNVNRGNRHYNYSNDDYLGQDMAVFGLKASKKGEPKKKNLNHLLNFTYESARDSNENYYEYERMTKQFWSCKLSKNSYFSKEQFLQANCQFLVKETGDYTRHMNDPDLLVDWDKIEEIYIDSHESMSCPICLYEPIAAKMTKCGHVYCWSCILHYLSLSDKTWRKCPICFESIYKKDLKSVRVNKNINDYKVGDEISLTLMFKSKTKYSNLILPYSCFEKYRKDEKNLTLNMLNDPDDIEYSKCKQYFKLNCKTDQQIYEDVIKREKIELTNQAEAEKNQPEVCFVNEALVLLEEREKNLLESNNNNTNKLNETKVNDETTITQDNLNNDYTFFYQSIDGQRIYINSLNTRCLINEYNTLYQSPLNIKAKIVAIDSHFMDEENRKKYRYLSHLPLHSEFKLAELDLKEPFISKKTLELFEQEIDDRKRFRERKEIREKRIADRAAAAAAAANSEYNHHPHYYVQSAMNDLKFANNENEFPEASTSPLSSGISVGESSCTSISNSSNSSDQSSSVSFAQALKHPNSAGRVNSSASSGSNDIAWPSLEASLAKTPATTNSNQQLTGWINMAKQHSQPVLGRVKKYQDAPSPWSTTTSKSAVSSNIDDFEENLESMPAPLYKASFFSSIDETLKAIESRKYQQDDVDAKNISDTGANSSNQDQNKPAINKKKKKTKQLLFSTSLNMGL